MGPKKRPASDEPTTPAKNKRTNGNSSVVSLPVLSSPLNSNEQSLLRVTKKATTATVQLPISQKSATPLGGAPLPAASIPQKSLAIPTPPSKTPQPQLSLKSKWEGRPTVAKTWTVFGAKHAEEYLKLSQTYDSYKISCRYFHGWLAFIARGLSIDELKQIFNACLSAFLKEW